MSLFENSRYQYRETFFVLFQQTKRPTGEQLKERLENLETRFTIENLVSNDEGQFESLTLLCPYDNSAMDITYVAGEDVLEQVAELNEEMRNATLTGVELKKLAAIGDCDARFDIYHFEETTGGEEDFLDPGSLLLVQQSLCSLTQGIGIDPQSGSLM